MLVSGCSCEPRNVKSSWVKVREGLSGHLLTWVYSDCIVWHHSTGNDPASNGGHGTVGDVEFSFNNE